MSPDSFTSQSDPAETRDYNLAFGAKSLINFGVAYVVSKMTAPPPEEIQDMVDSIRVPSGAGGPGGGH